MLADRESAPICGIILAAGTSTRMGRAKHRLPLNGKPLLQHAIDATDGAQLSEIIVVVGDQARDVVAALALPGRARVAVNADFALGLASSLRCGLRAAGDNAVAAAILLGDEPEVASATIDAVIDAWRQSDAPIARATYTDAGGSVTPGHPVVIDRSLWPLVDELRGDEGLRAIIRAYPEWVLDVEVPHDPPRDIDTPDDYRAAGGDVSFGDP